MPHPHPHPAQPGQPATPTATAPAAPVSPGPAVQPDQTPDRTPDTPPPGLLHGRWYSTEELAALLGVDASTLRRWRTATPLQGPPFVPIGGRRTLYSDTDVQTWLSARRIDPALAA
ncbi:MULTISPECIES: helix-turn-helix transcriptional regulator [unclassified Streptomyces]|uniref:helix-turn-helix transcriptional regulator n=1 Tax=unclassified Streptomyces TaxID=2593676 RepID=UPI002E2CE463|nr:helix-turn-helix domain-containing protein [Streptomyces sp. NBC_00223]